MIIRVGHWLITFVVHTSEVKYKEDSSFQNISFCLNFMDQIKNNMSELYHYFTNILWKFQDKQQTNKPSLLLFEDIKTIRLIIVQYYSAIYVSKLAAIARIDAVIKSSHFHSSFLTTTISQSEVFVGQISDRISLFQSVFKVLSRFLE